MLKRFIAFIIIFTITLKCYGTELSFQDKVTLEGFFRILLEHSEGGYVIYGEKPVCINGFRVRDSFTMESPNHYSSVYLREGAKTWKKLTADLKPENLIVHVYNQPDSLAKNFIHILFINRDLFLQTVQNNLPLFQYVLGPEVTPIKLLNQLTDPNEKFHSVLKNDKVLIGILLGFGVQNSLYASRIENLEEAVFSPEQPPLNRKIAKFGEMEHLFAKRLLIRNSINRNSVSIDPSFCFDSVSNELRDLSQKLELSSPKLAQNHPQFIFGRLKDDKETEKMIVKLENCQDKIVPLLASPSFLEDVLKLIYPNLPISIHTLPHDSTLFSETESKQIPCLVAADIWDNLEEEDAVFRTAFIKGMQDCNAKLEKKTSANVFLYDRLKALKEIKNALLKSDEYFSELKKDATMTEIFPSKLYSRTLAKGNGKELSHLTRILVKYSITSPEGEVLASTFDKPEELDLRDTIPGFAWGIKGMKGGETREIFIHPSLAYGIYTTLEKGIYLKARVTLLEFEEGGSNFSPLKPLDLSAAISPKIDSEYNDQAKNVGYVSGYDVWEHFKKSNLYKLEDILSYLSQFQNGLFVDVSSEENQDLLNRLHWTIYESSK